MKRTIKLKCIKDPHIVEFVDGGVDREGEPTGQRQALARVLGKRTTAIVDGKEGTFPVFLIESIGEWKMAPGEVMPTGDAFMSFEEDVIRREHPEHMLERWSKAQAAFIAESIDARRQAEKRLENEQSADLAKTMRDMMRGYAAQSAPAKKGAANV